jgi:hypothetical protein
MTDRKARATATKGQKQVLRFAQDDNVLSVFGKLLD